MDFEIGQRVKIIGSEVELGEYFAERCAGMVGNLTEIKHNDPDGVTHRVEFDGNYLGVWVKPEHLEVIPDDGKQPAATPEVTPQSAPLLQQKNSDGEVMSARNVLLKFPDLATRQPHLFLVGEYEEVSAFNMQRLDTPYIRISGTADMADKYLVFIIAEDE